MSLVNTGQHRLKGRDKNNSNNNKLMNGDN